MRIETMNGATINDKTECLMKLRELLWLLMVENHTDFKNDEEYWFMLDNFMGDINGFLKRH